MFNHVRVPWDLDKTGSSKSQTNRFIHLKTWNTKGSQFHISVRNRLVKSIWLILILNYHNGLHSWFPLPESDFLLWILVLYVPPFNILLSKHKEPDIHRWCTNEDMPVNTCMLWKCKPCCCFDLNIKHRLNMHNMSSPNGCEECFLLRVSCAVSPSEQEKSCIDGALHVCEPPLSWTQKHAETSTSTAYIKHANMLYWSLSNTKQPTVSCRRPGDAAGPQ